MSETARREGWDRHLGFALLILGGLLLLVKVLSWTAVQFLLRLWPVALIFIGWHMYRTANDARDDEDAAEDD